MAVTSSFRHPLSTSCRLHLFLLQLGQRTIRQGRQYAHGREGTGQPDQADDTHRTCIHSAGEEVEPAYWLGKYSDMPHILSFLNESYQAIFEVLETDNEVAPLLGPFQTALKNKAMEQLEGMIGTLRVYTSRLAT